MGDGHRSVPAHLWLKILGLIYEDAYHVRRANAGPKKQGDVLGSGHRPVPAHAFLKDLRPNILTRNAGVLGSIPGLVTYFRYSFRFFKKGSCQLLAKVYARSIG